MQTTIKLFVTFLVCLTLLLVSGCGGGDGASGGAASGGNQHPEELVSMWVLTEGRHQTSWEFSKDGTGIFTDAFLGQDTQAVKFTWKVEKDRLHVTYSSTNATDVFDYTISGSTLTMSGEEYPLEYTKRPPGGF